MCISVRVYDNRPYLLKFFVSNRRTKLTNLSGEFMDRIMGEHKEKVREARESGWRHGQEEGN